MLPVRMRGDESGGTPDSASPGRVCSAVTATASRTATSPLGTGVDVPPGGEPAAIMPTAE